MDFAKKDFKGNPFAKASLISKVLFLWVIPIFLRGHQKDLELEDLYDPVKEDLANELADNAEEAWTLQLKTAKEKRKFPSLVATLYIIVGKQYLLFSVGLVIGETIFRVAAPIALRELIKTFDDKSTASQREQYLFAGAVCLSPLLTTLFYHPSAFQLYRISMRCRLALSSLIYRKSLRLSSSAQRQTNIGAIVNLLSNDVNRFDHTIIFFLYLLIGTAQVTVFSILLYLEFGLVGLSGIALLFLILQLQYFNLKLVTKYRRQIAQRTDERGRVMNEIIMGIRILKMYAWEKPFSAVIHALRKLELKPLKKRLNVRGLSLVIYSTGVKLLVFITILAYVLDGNTITADKVFFLTSAFNVVALVWLNHIPSAISGFGEIRICLKRIKTFLLLDEKVTLDNFITLQRGAESPPKIILDNVSSSWAQPSPDVRGTLSKINTSLSGDKIVIVVGPCGAGKSSLLQVLLGELPVLHGGKCIIQGNISYSSQEPWIFAGSVKQNILFGRAFNNEKYDRATEAAALLQDFKQLPCGDNTIVGERGVSLSGGQKARVNLARCLYQDADIYLLDDPLSAVDTKVSKHLFDNCIKKKLSGKLRILVTHQLQYLPQADHIIVLSQGRILAQGTYAELMEAQTDFVNLMTPEDNDDNNNSRRASVASVITDLRRLSKKMSRSSITTMPQETPNADRETKIKEETKATGSVGWRLYVKYFKMGKAPFLLFLTMTMFALSQVFLSGINYSLSFWTNAESRRFGNSSVDDDKKEGNYLGRNTYIYIYVGIMCGALVACTFRSTLFFNYCTRIGVNMHNSMFLSLVRAKTRFFDENPSGRIMNRFTKDLGAADELLPPTFFDTIILFTEMIGTITIIVISNYYLAPAAIVVLLILIVIRSYYVNTARDIKRIEGIAKSPIFTHAASSFTGLATIRALQVEPVLIRQFDELQDIHTSPWFLFFSSTRCFSTCVEITSVLFLAVISFSFLLMQDSVEVGNVGLAISSALGLSGDLQYGLRQSAEVENHMTSVERCLEYSELPFEAPLDSDNDKKPPKDWPSDGCIKFDTVSLAYDDGDEKPTDVLKQVSFEIRPNEKVGIVGRTGAGKSSLISALFRMSEPRGNILIDDVKINEIGLHDLRRNISIIPQDPVLFSGTVRYNLDPLSEFPDDQLWSALADVELKNEITALDSAVADGGRNFSVGQRQLVCMARAILRKNKIIVMDEVTSNVDPATDLLIQKTIRAKFAECSIITVAHRLHSVIDCDRILVLDNGRLIEYDHPHLLLENPSGIFSEMVKHTGKSSSAMLNRIAADTFHSRRSSVQKSDLSGLTNFLGQLETYFDSDVGEHDDECRMDGSE